MKQSLLYSHIFKIIILNFTEYFLNLQDSFNLIVSKLFCYYLNILNDFELINALDEFIDSLFSERKFLQNFLESFKIFFWIKFDERTFDANSIFVLKTEMATVPSLMVFLSEDESSLVIVASRKSVGQTSLSDLVKALKKKLITFGSDFSIFTSLLSKQIETF